MEYYDVALRLILGKSCSADDNDDDDRLIADEAPLYYLLGSVEELTQLGPVSISTR
jgi:hypothetical protein